jgi:hypothetical protein
MMKKRSVRRAALIGVMTPMLLLAACAQTPMGPTVQVMPAPGKPLDVFAADQAGCRQFAEQAVAGQAQNANNRAVGAAAITTVLGAGAVLRSAPAAARWAGRRSVRAAAPTSRCRFRINTTTPTPSACSPAATWCRAWGRT